MTPPSLRDLILQRIKREQKPRLRISQAGLPCIRELYYRATGEPCEPHSKEALIKMAIGSALDAYALNGLETPEAMSHVPVSINLGGDLTLLGEADIAFYEDGTPLLVSDLKCVGEATWSKVQQEPKHEHQAQVNLYAFGLGALTWSVLYVRVATGEMLEHHRPTDEFAARRDFGFFEEAAYWLLRNEPPPKPYDNIEEDDGTMKLARDAFPCRFCAYRATCWPVNNEGSDGNGELISAA